MKLNDWKMVCPYGKWTCADGREVLFSRSYWPILERRPGAPVKAAGPNERIPYVQQFYFFDDANCPWNRSDIPGARETISRVNQVLSEWGLPALPPLTGGRSKKLPRGLIRANPLKWTDPKDIPLRVNPWASRINLEVVRLTVG